MGDIKMNELGGASRLSVVSSAQKTQTAKTSSSTAEVGDIKAQSKSVQEQESSQQVSKAQVENAVTKLNDFVQTVQRNLQFNLDDTSGKTIITVVDKETSEVVRQIPDDVAIKLAQDLQQSEPLSLFNAKV